MTTPQPKRSRRRPARRSGRDAPQQRFGRIIDRQPTGSGAGGQFGTYYVRADETGTTYTFSYPDIVTEGFRTIRTGERVRFLTDPAKPGRAIYVIRLDLPDIESYYA